MARVSYQVRITIQPRPGGGADVVLPTVLRKLKYDFVAVKEGGEEAIIRVDEPAEVQKRVGQSQACTRLTPAQLTALRASYPPPKIKERYRTLAPPAAAGDTLFETDEKGQPVVEHFQTVRAGFYLLDVPVLPAAQGTAE
jgi:hypothetical protein